MTTAHPGPALQAARLLRRESLQAAAAATGLPRKVLDALESGRSLALLDDLQHRGQLRIYARHLGLEAEEVLHGLGSKGGGSGARQPVLLAWLAQRRSKP